MDWRKREITINSALVAFFLLLTHRAFSDERSYVWTYEYKTVERGEAEVEYYFTLSSTDVSRMRGLARAEHQIELEVGMTGDFDFSIYQIFEQEMGESLKYKGFKMRWRYMLPRFFIDPLLYLEYKGLQDFSEHTIELKFIIARDFGKLNIALNPILEIEKEDEWKVEPEYAAGLRYRFTRLFSAGIEFKGSEYGHYISPVIAHGKSNAWVALGSAFKISPVKEGKPEFEIRLLLGIGSHGWK